MAKIVFFEVEEWEKQHISKGLKGAVFFNEHLDVRNAEKAKDAEIIAIFIYSKITKDVLDKLPKLKLIATMSTGYDHIDLNECSRRGIRVCNVPNYGENTVAEHTFSMILALSRKLIESVERTKKGDFSLDKLRGSDLKGKTIGIIGMGSIGMHIARIAKGFEMKILAYDINKDKKLAAKLAFRYSSIKNLLNKSDIITLHCPLNKATHHLVNRNNIRQIKRGSILINTARGGLVETEALIDALDRGILSGAGLDVLEEECAIKEEKQLLSKKFSQECNLKTVLQNHILLRMDKVIVTPHNAFNSNEALLRIIETTIRNVQAFKKQRPLNTVKAR